MVSTLKSLFQQKKKYKNMSTLSSKDYFFGKISRQRAEEILFESGGEDGRFLMRECLSSPMDFSMAVCFNGKPYHYQLKLKEDGTLDISRNLSFPNIDKMIAHYNKNSSGLITKLRHPCLRDNYGGAQVWPSISQTTALLYVTEAGKNKSSKYEDVIEQIYRKQPWFKGGMTREESKDYLLQKCNGQFIIREKADGTLALSVAYEGKVYHYVIDIEPCLRTGSNSYKINPGPAFDNIMELVTYYHNGGLACPLHLDYQQSKKSVPWMKNNPAFKEHKTKRFSRSLESLNIFEEDKFDDDEAVPSASYEHPNRNLLLEETSKKSYHDKVTLGFPKSMKVPDIRIHHPAQESQSRTNDESDEVKREFRTAKNLPCLSQPRASTDIVKSSRQTLHPQNDSLSRNKSPSRSPKLGKKLPFRELAEKLFKEDCQKKDSKKIKHQQSAPTNQEGARKFSLTTSDLKIRPKMDSVSEAFRKSFDENSDDSQCNKSLAPPKPHDQKKKQRGTSRTPSPKHHPNQGISYELEEAFLAMIKREAYKYEKVKHLCAENKSKEAIPHVPLKYFPAERIPEIQASQMYFSSTLGKGNFGIVHRAILNKNTEVAVKSSVPGPHKVISELELMKEAQLMSLMNHENIIKLLGICRGSESTMLVLELAHLGNLKNYLASNRDTSEHQIVKALIQVCDGMSFLESKQIIHRDLAARNILLFKNWIAKISDFGLSRSMTNKSYYEFIGKKALPLKWYPPEVFNKDKFSHKSDVWSFGVAMWESMSCGANPYSELSIEQYFDFISKGRRLKRPDKCSEKLYRAMNRCWHEREEDRLTFAELTDYLKNHYRILTSPM